MGHHRCFNSCSQRGYVQARHRQKPQASPTLASSPTFAFVLLVGAGLTHTHHTRMLGSPKGQRLPPTRLNLQFELERGSERDSQGS